MTTCRPILLLLLGLLPFLNGFIFADSATLPGETDRQKERDVLLRQEVLQHLEPGSGQLMRFSRRRLISPTIEWRETVAAGKQTFLIRHAHGQPLLGLYLSEKKDVWLFDADAMSWVAAPEHPLLAKMRQSDGTASD